MLIESQSGIRCQGLYRGLVLQHLPHGRLKVFVYGVYAEEYINQPDLLPICEQITPLWAGSFVGNGSFSYPNISSVVWVQFANEDVNYPVVIGATLGGENAYHQYEQIKAQDEEISKKHMFTTGMAHFQMHESGKISSYVQQPYDNNVSIDFSQGDVSCEVRADIEDKIRNNEISHIICQNVIDNELNNGEISSSTFYFYPSIDFNTSVYLSDLQETIEESGNKNISAGTYSIRNNKNNIIDNQFYFAKNNNVKYKKSTNNNTIESLINNNISVETSISSTLNEINNNINHIKSITADYQNSLTNESKSYIENLSAFNKFNININGITDLHNKYKQNYKENGILSTFEKTFVLSSTSGSNAIFEIDNYENINNSDIIEGNSTIQFVQNKDNNLILIENKNRKDKISCYIEVETNKDKQSYKKIFKSNEVEFRIEINPRTGFLEIFADKNLHKCKLKFDVQNGKIETDIVKNNNSCKMNFDVNNGKIDIDAHDKCKINFNASSGQINIKSNTNINLESPNININGITTFTGNMNVIGNITTTGNIATTSNIVATGSIISNRGVLGPL